MGMITNIIGYLALLVGLIIFYREKGNRKHRFWGKIYVLLIFLLIVSSFYLMSPYENIGAQLVFKIICLAFVIAGAIPLILRDKIKVWVVWHYILMLYSYLFLLMANLSQLLDYFTEFLISFKMIESEANIVSRSIFWFLPFIIGTIWIFSKRTYYENKFRNKMMRYPEEE